MIGTIPCRPATRALRDKVCGPTINRWAGLACNLLISMPCRTSHSWPLRSGIEGDGSVCGAPASGSPLQWLRRVDGTLPMLTAVFTSAMSGLESSFRAGYVRIDSRVSNHYQNGERDPSCVSSIAPRSPSPWRQTHGVAAHDVQVPRESQWHPIHRLKLHGKFEAFKSSKLISRT